MWAAIVVVVLICGYQYVDSHLPSKYKLNQAVGWNAYFHVALKGAEFFIQGIFISIVVVCALYVLMWFLNAPAYLFDLFIPLTFASDIMSFRVFGLSMWSCLCLGATILISFGSTIEAREDNESLEKRINGFREIAKENAIEGIILESLDRMEDGLLLLVTLKSRKVYVGIVDTARFEGMDTNSLVLIPFMSGYRDKDTLSFKVEHNYTLHYAKEGITFNSKPLSVYQFRHVLPYEQIESLSLFNVNTYIKFQEIPNSNEVQITANQ
ncbi:hypothetical protein VRQ87_003972 [Morganella morganii]|nr:hypothetical protein [Morganella morganii]EMD6374034.1 hypothetical protein [Morganella morganii]